MGILNDVPRMDDKELYGHLHRMNKKSAGTGCKVTPGETETGETTNSELQTINDSCLRL